MEETCDYCGMPSTTSYVLATDTEGNPALSHYMCDGCAMEVGQEVVEDSSDEESVIHTDGTRSESEPESDPESDTGF